jgi:hypothetical protein
MACCGSTLNIVTSHDGIVEEISPRDREISPLDQDISPRDLQIQFESR